MLSHKPVRHWRPPRCEDLKHLFFVSGTVQVSDDGGRAWRHRERYARRGQFAGYSDMVRVERDVGVLVEWGPSIDRRDRHKEIRFIRVDRRDLRI